MVAASFVSLLPIVGRGPAAVQDRFLGVFVETLPQEFRTQIAAMDVTFAPALLGHWCHPAEALQIFASGETLALRAHAGQQAGRQDRSSSGKGFKDLAVGVLLEDLGNLFLELLYGPEQELEFFADELHAQSVAL